MKTFRIVLILIAVAIIIAQLILLDYTNLTYSENIGNYLVIIAMVLVIISMVLSHRKEKSKQV